MVRDFIKEIYKEDVYRIKFIKDCFKISNPLNRNETNFILNDQQKKLVELMYNNSYTVCKKGRQLGATSTLVAAMLSKALFAPNNSTFVYITNDITTKNDIYSKLKYFINQIANVILNGSFIFEKDTLTFSNGTKIILGTPLVIREKYLKNVDTLIVDEISFMKENELNQLLRELQFNYVSFGKTKIMFIGTPNGKNYFYHLYKILDNKYSMDWWNDPRFNNDLLWYKNGDYLYRTDKTNYSVLMFQEWIPINMWFINMCKAFNMDFNKINSEISNQFI